MSQAAGSARIGSGDDSWAELTAAWREYGPRIAGWLLPFALVLYLGLRGGGYDAVIRGELGIAVWWIVLLGALLGVLPVARLNAAAWGGIGALAGLTAWTALGLGWSESAERTATELARVSAFLGVFVLALSAQRGEGMRRTVNGLAAGLAVLAGIALLSRIHPAWFGNDELAAFQPGAADRLSYPVNYWNGLAALMAMALPLLLSCAIHCRYAASRALAAAAVPVVALTAFYTLSRGGAIECAAGVLALVLLTRRRLALLAPLAISAGGAAILIAGAAQREDLQNALSTPAAANQADEMLAMALVVCAGVGLLVAAVALADKYRLVRVNLSPQARRAGLATVLIVGAIGLIGFGVPAASNGWDDFKSSSSGGEGTSRFTSISGNGRYQYWSSALDANRSESLTGTGPGTFEFWWAREGDIPGFVRDAHSLYMESLAEVGIIGFLLVVGLIGGVIGVGSWRSLRGPRDTRTPRAAATAAAVAFAVAAGVDWAWELSVLPIAFLLCAAVILTPRRSSPNPPPAGREAIATRAGLGALALAGIVVIALPLAGAVRIRESQADARAGDLAGALDRAQAAADAQPYAATPKLQEALVLELQHQLPAARAAAVAATQKESTNWRTWLVLSRIEAELNHPQASLAAYERGKALNPRSPLFAGGTS